MINPQDDRMKWTVRSVYVLLVALYVYTLRDHFAYMPISFLTIMKWTVMCAVWNSGLWIITTKWAVKWKLLSVLLYLPTMITSPFLAWGWVSAFVCFLVMLAILFIYFPRRNHASTMATNA